MHSRPAALYLRCFAILSAFCIATATLFVLYTNSEGYTHYKASQRIRKAWESIRFLQAPINILPATPEDHARNSTLGFESILALSRGTPWRVHGLQAAARETGLDIVIPKQPSLSPMFVSALKDSNPENATSYGQALGWLAHMDLLKHVISSGFETALILEDDADWGVEIKEQMGRLSAAIRSFTDVSEEMMSPFGDAWDVLWLGLCAEDWLGAEPRLDTFSYPDPTVGLRKDWMGIVDPERLKGLPEGHRSIFPTNTAVCTWAYAVTRDSAVKLLEWAQTGADLAFDVKLQNGCKKGGLRCFSVIDQLFHQYSPAPEFGYTSDINYATHGESAPEGEAIETTKGRTETILHSARCKALFNETCYVGR